MTYAYRRTTDALGCRTIDLFVSETGQAAPADFRTCTATQFARAWRVKNVLALYTLEMRRRPLINPYEP